VGDPFHVYVSWFWTGGATSGSRQVTAPLSPGLYEFRYLLLDGYNQAAISNPLIVY
jgi:hypothetical protein